jgi:protoporphyrinogen oxidase
MQNFETDIVIIGAGPVGLFAVFQAGMLKMRTHVVDTLEAVGGLLYILKNRFTIFRAIRRFWRLSWWISWLSRPNRLRQRIIWGNAWS